MSLFNSDRAYLDARVIQVRLLSAELRSAPSQPSATPQQIELNINTTIGFTLAVDDINSPKGLLIDIDFTAQLLAKDTGKEVANYKSKHSGQFVIIAWQGFHEWSQAPNEAIAPYLSLLHGIAIRRAENTFGEMGLKGINLPRPESFDTPTSEAPPEATRQP